MSLVRDWSSSACPVRRVATIAKGIYTTTPMFSPRPKDSIPTDGPARGATEGQPHAPDSMRPDAVVARSHCSPLSTQGAPNDQTTVQQDRLRRAATPSFQPMRLSTGSQEKAMQPKHRAASQRQGHTEASKARDTFENCFFGGSNRSIISLNIGSVSQLGSNRSIISR